jgi:phosphoglycerate dehydrogenase-like enzyme
MASMALLETTLGLLLAAGTTQFQAEAPVRSAAPARSSAAAEEELGSTRNARVALPGAAQEKEIVYVAGDVARERLDELRRIAPHLRVVSNPTPEEALALAPETRGIDARFATPDFLSRATRLVWVQAMSAGVERLVAQPAIAEKDAVVLTNLRGVHGPAIADHAFAMLLALTRDLRPRLEAQSGARWAREGSGARPVALEGKTMLVVGLGGIGREVAERARGFGMKVIATRRSSAPAPAWVEEIGKPEELLRLLPRADVVVICVPLTKETENLFDERAFRAMKRGSFLINVARGRIVDHQALVRALQDRRLAGAGLDVTHPEPLPRESPLWAMANVVITPHVAGRAEITDERAWALLRENLRRFAAGEPLLNVVDKKAGY